MMLKHFVEDRQVQRMTKLFDNSLFSRIINEIELVCRQNCVDESHGLSHAIKIAELTQQAMLSENVDSELKQDVICSALLHDIDDRKYFNTLNYKNALNILQKNDVSRQRTKRIITMIDLVSFAKNGNNVSREIPYIYYITRYIDRIQAIGIQGLHRSLVYNNERLSKVPIYCESTPRPSNYRELHLFKLGRDIQYMKSGVSSSVVDHVFDKLLHIKLPLQIANEFMMNLYISKIQQMQEFVLRHAAENYINYQSDLYNEYEKNKHLWYNLQ